MRYTFRFRFRFRWSCQPPGCKARSGRARRQLKASLQARVQKATPPRKHPPAPARSAKTPAKRRPGVDTKEQRGGAAASADAAGAGRNEPARRAADPIPSAAARSGRQSRCARASHCAVDQLGQGCSLAVAGMQGPQPTESWRAKHRRDRSRAFSRTRPTRRAAAALVPAFRPRMPLMRPVFGCSRPQLRGAPQFAAPSRQRPSPARPSLARACPLLFGVRVSTHWLNGAA